TSRGPMIRKVSIPLGEQLMNPFSASGAVATKKTRCWWIHSASSELISWYCLPMAHPFHPRLACDLPKQSDQKSDTNKTWPVKADPRSPRLRPLINDCSRVTSAYCPKHLFYAGTSDRPLAQVFALLVVCLNHRNHHLQPMRHEMDLFELEAVRWHFPEPK